MKQLVNLRHNPILIPAKDKTLLFHELIFIAGRKEYELDTQHEPRQLQKTHVFRCMADERTIVQTASRLLSLLPTEALAGFAQGLNELLKEAAQPK